MTTPLILVCVIALIFLLGMGLGFLWIAMDCDSGKYFEFFNYRYSCHGIYNEVVK